NAEAPALRADQESRAAEGENEQDPPADTADDVEDLGDADHTDGVNEEGDADDGGGGSRGAPPRWRHWTINAMSKPNAQCPMLNAQRSMRKGFPLGFGHCALSIGL